jgi:hypothetical protein
VDRPGVRLAAGVLHCHRSGPAAGTRRMGARRRTAARTLRRRSR